MFSGDRLCFYPWKPLLIIDGYSVTPWVLWWMRLCIKNQLFMCNAKNCGEGQLTSCVDASTYQLELIGNRSVLPPPKKKILLSVHVCCTDVDNQKEEGQTKRKSWKRKSWEIIVFFFFCCNGVLSIKTLMECDALVSEAVIKQAVLGCL